MTAEHAPALTAAEREVLTKALASAPDGCWDYESCCWSAAEAMFTAVEAILRDRLPDATTSTEWGVRHEPTGDVYPYPVGGEKRAREIAARYSDCIIVRRRLGPWKRVPDGK